MKHRCDEFSERIGDSSDLAASTAEERAMLDEHLGECGDCLASMKGIIVQRNVLGALFRDERAGAALSDDLVARCVAAMKRAAAEGSQSGGVRTA